LIGVSVLSGNRNFEARVHQSIKANFLMSPPLVVACALAGRIDIDMLNEPIGSANGEDVYLKDIWPTLDEVRDATALALSPEEFRKVYSNFADKNPLWNEIPMTPGLLYQWDASSTYIQEPPFFQDFTMNPGRATDLHDARPLAIFGDSVTTDHISPAGMGVLPLQFDEGTSAQTLALDGTETFDVIGIESGLRPMQKATLRIHRSAGSTDEVAVIVRIDTPIEVDYYVHGGILPFVL